MTAPTRKRPTRSTPAAPPEPSSRIVITHEKITPEMAEELMHANVENNRHVRFAQVERYARDMAAGKWQDNGETIKIDTNGLMIDGQHRIQAIIEAGVPVELWVARGLEPQAITSIDIGVSRKYSDLLKLEGQTNVLQLAAFLRRLYLWERGIRVSRGSVAPSPAEMDTVLHNNSALIKLSMTRAEQTRQGFKPLTPAVGATAFFLFARIQIDQAHTFFDRLTDGAIADVGHPIMRLRHRLYNAPQGRKLNPDEKLACVIRTWNHYRAGNSVESIVITPRGQLNDNNFPEPE